MFRSRPPIPQPERPSDATNQVNYLSAQVQQILSIILPQPVVTVLAAISDALYRLVLGQSNDPPTYTSTLAPPFILIAVTYLAILLVYKSIRSFVGMLIFSLKWAVILGVIGFLLAYHYGNGDVQQGAQSIAQQSGLSSSSWTNVIRNYQSVQQIGPLLSFLPSSLGFNNNNDVSSNRPSSPWYSQAGSNYNRQRDGLSGSVPSSNSRNEHVREYRDLRPSRYEESTSPPLESQKRKDSKKSSQKADEGDLLDVFSRWLGADLSGGGGSSSGKKKRT